MITNLSSMFIKLFRRALCYFVAGCLLFSGACNSAPQITANGTGQITDDTSDTNPDSTLGSNTDIIGAADAGSDDEDLSLVAKMDDSMVGLWQIEVASKRRSSLSDFRYEWDFGSGEIFYGATQRRVFSSAGMYTIVVRVFDGFNNVVATLSLEVDVTAPGEPPEADAGPNQVVLEGEIVLLDGSNSSDPANAPLLFHWTQIGGPPVTLANADGTVASFVAPQVDKDETIQFKLSVSNGVSLVEDIVFVDTLNQLDTASNSLVVLAGDDQTVAIGDTVTLDGSQSNSSTGGSMSFQWSQVSGTSVSLTDATKNIATFVAPNVTTTDLLTFKLVASDGSQIAQDLVNVTVEAGVIDNCPSDANKTDPGQCGCGVPDVDSDGDGVLDCNDLCPDDPGKSDPGTCGCGVSDADLNNDGVPDCVDACPNDPNKSSPGQCGCGVADTDTDSDGTPDCNDACPTDSNKVVAGQCGCGVLDVDTDGDGTFDCDDLCPADANKTAPGICGCGATDVDSDGDGAPDCNDQCPNDANKTLPGICGCGNVDTDVNGDGVCDSQPPTVSNQTATTNQDIATTLTLNGSDPEGDDLTFRMITGPTQGSLGSFNNSAISSATVVYTPSAGFSGTDTFSFVANDGTSDSNTAIVTITVNSASQNLTLNFSTYLGGSGEDTIRDVFVDDAGFIYLTGGTASSNFPTTAGAYDRTLNTSGSPIHDVFVTKLSPSGNIVWSTLLGGPNYDRAYSIEVDQAGFVYVGGRAGAGFPTTSGVLQPNFAGDVNPNSRYGRQDGFVAKISPDGSRLVWATYFGDDDRSFIRDFDIDSQGSVYLVLTDGARTNPHVTAGAFQTSPGGSKDGVIAKLSTDASQVIWASYLGGSGSDVGTPSLRVDAAGQPCVLGFTNSTNMPTTNGAYDRTFNGGPGDVHLAKFSADGSQLLFGTFLGGSAGEFTETHGLALDSSGNAYVAVTTKSTNFPTTNGAFQRTYGGTGGSGTGSGTNYNGDAFIAKISADGSTLMAATYLGGRDGEGLEGVSVLPNGDVVVSGATFSSNFPSTSDAYQQNGGTKGDFFVAMLKGDLSSVVYVSYLGGNDADYGRSATTDSNGYVYVIGHTKSTNWPKLNAQQPSYGGGKWDGGVVKFAY